MTDKWNKAQEWELDWHGNCINSYHEEQKQLVYAEKMGLTLTQTPKTPYTIDLAGTNVLDIGGGAYSLLLKCTGFNMATVADPLMDKFPKWVIERYKAANIFTVAKAGEDTTTEFMKTFAGAGAFNEVWIYNVLEHVIDPKKVLDNALELGNVVRIFEWVETRENIGHPHCLHEDELNKWLGGIGKVESVRHDGANGLAYFGIFKGRNFA